MKKKSKKMKLSFGSGINLQVLLSSGALALLACLLGCGSTKLGAKKDDFFTSGSREADQRASQTMAKHEQLAGSGEGAGEKGVKKAKVTKPEDESLPGATNKAAQVEGKLALYDRLGGEEGISKIVSDFVPRVLEDPRVNWERKGVSPHKFSFHRHQSEAVLWQATPENITALKKHLVQFIAIASGGPAKYDGKEIKTTHAPMHISNPEFDAVIGDLKASLDRLQIPNKEQKELLAIVESTRPEIVTER